MKHLKHHAMHLLMCAPMVFVAAVILAGDGGSYRGHNHGR